MIKTKCAICELDNHKILYKANFNLNNINEETFSARRIPDKIHYQIVRCKKCGLVYSNPILENKKIEKLYKKSTYTYGHYESDLSETYKKYLTKFLPLIKTKNTFLEIGCGNGFFLKEAKKMGFNKVYGVEPGIETVKMADKKIKKNIIIDIFKKGQFRKESVNLICLFQVLDHIPDPNGFLLECNKILTTGGAVLCINHNVDGLSAKLLAERSPIFDIEHTYLYNKTTLPEIFRKNDYTIKKVFDVTNSYPLSYWLRMFPLPFTVKKLLEKFLTLIRLSDRKIWINAGNIGIFAQKP